MTTELPKAPRGPSHFSRGWNLYAQGLPFEHARGETARLGWQAAQDEFRRLNPPNPYPANYMEGRGGMVGYGG